MQSQAPALGTRRVPVLAVQPRYLPTPDVLETHLPAGHAWLLVEQRPDEGIATTLMAMLERRGEKVTRIQAQDIASADRVAGVLRQSGPVGGLIALSSLSLGETDDLLWVRTVFLLAGAVQPLLTQAGAENPGSRPGWITVSRGDGYLGTSAQPSSAAQIGGLAGLSKTLRLEWPEVYCRHIDLEATMAPEQAAQAVFAELYDPDRRLTETAWNAQGRMTLTTVKEADGVQSALFKTPDADTVFLVSGGGRGITAECVIALANRYHSKFVLVGRSSWDDAPEPAWAQDIADAAELKQAAATMLREAGEKPNPRLIRATLNPLLAQREIRSTLQSVAEAGGQARYVQADVTDIDSLQAAVNVAEAEIGKVTAILHGAGVLADKLIQDKQPDDFDRVVGVKVLGLQNMLACVVPDTLQALVLFSSVAGYYGNLGQADYALANDILNKTARQWASAHPDCRVLALDWGPWDGGMVTPALKRVLASRHIDVIPVPDGTAILADALAAPRTAIQYVIGSEMLPPAVALKGPLQTHHIRRELQLASNPFLLDHVIGGHAVLPTVCAVAWMANAAEQLYPGYHYFSVVDYRVFKGIVFDDDACLDYELDLTETHKVDGDRVVLDIQVRSETDAGKPRYHYGLTLTLVRETPEAPVFAGFDLAEKEGTAGVELYDGEILFHGPSFRGIDRILNRSDTGLTMRCRLPVVPVDIQGQFPVQTFNPYMVDVQLQSLLVWAKDVYGYGGLPLSIDGGVQYHNVAFGETSYATLQITRHTPRRLVADVTIHDEHGRIYTQVTNAEITLSDRLNTLFGQNQISLQESN